MNRFLLALVLFFCPLFAQAAPGLDNHIFAQLPVQHEGRIEPMDSFARDYLKQIYGNTAGRSATDWLAELLFNPEGEFARPTFKVANPDTRHALDLPETKEHLYSFRALASAFTNHAKMMQSLLETDEKNITDPAQREILGFYQNMQTYFEISRSLSLVLPDFKIDNPELARKIGVAAGSFSYLEMMQHKLAYFKLAKEELEKIGSKTPNADQENLLRIGYLLEQMEPDKQSRVLQIIPPVWEQNKGGWLSPWEVLEAGQGSPQTAALLDAWRDMTIAYRAQDQTAWDNANQKVLLQTRNLAEKTVRPAALKAEYIYNLTHLFALSGLCYLIELVVLISSRLNFGSNRIALIALICGFSLHTIGLLLRIFILARPPVGTLYESLLFVGWVAVTGSFIFEWRSKRGLGLLLGAIAGLTLQMLSPFFAQGGDTMAPLVAVLNTNFWLATHVLAITTGYGCCLVASILAHFYLIQRIRAPDHREQSALLLRAVLSAALVAVCFATIGTVLGGIWADQSWGRFWGWDPKENGALLIVLWLLFILHGRLSGLLHHDNFAIGSAATIIVVALSWFGVNLLNVGLHSYGFTSGIALYLGVFVAVELMILGTCRFLLNRQRKTIS